MTTETVSWGVSDDLVNDALAWALVPIRVEMIDGELEFVTTSTTAEVLSDLMSAILVLYLRFNGHQDAQEILEQATRLTTQRD